MADLIDDGPINDAEESGEDSGDEEKRRKRKKSKSLSFSVVSA